MDEKKISILIKSVIFLASAYMASGIAAQLIRGNISTVTTPILENRSTVFKAGRKFAFDHYRPVWENNFFNPNKISVKGDIPPVKTEKKVEILDQYDDKNLPLSALNYKLIGTVVGPVEKSFAIIVIPGKKKQVLYHQGDNIDGVIITKVKRTRVILNNKGRKEVLEMNFDDPSKGGGVNTFKERFSSTTEGITRISANSFILDKKEAERLSGNVTQFMTQVRVVPNVVKGKPSGYKLLNIKRGSLIEKMGLKNGDIVREINGTSINKPEEAFQAYQQLKNGGSFVLDIDRRGKKETIHYEVR